MLLTPYQLALKWHLFHFRHTQWSEAKTKHSFVILAQCHIRPYRTRSDSLSISLALLWVVSLCLRIVWGLLTIGNFQRLLPVLLEDQQNKTCFVLLELCTTYLKRGDSSYIIRSCRSDTVETVPLLVSTAYLFKVPMHFPPQCEIHPSISEVFVEQLLQMVL